MKSIIGGALFLLSVWGFAAPKQQADIAGAHMMSNVVFDYLDRHASGDGAKTSAAK